MPTLNGLSTHELSPLWGPFVLINAGCTLRVVGQTLTDFQPLAFPVTGVSGILEVTGLALWGAHLVLIMCGRARVRATTPGSESPANREIRLTDTVGAVLEAYPDLLGTFLANGFTPLANPSARRTIAKAITMRHACRHIRVEPTEFLSQLNAEHSRLAAVELKLIEPAPNARCIH